MVQLAAVNKQPEAGKNLHTCTILIDTTNLVDGVGKPNTGKDVSTSKVHHMIRIANCSNKTRLTLAPAAGKPLHSRK